MSIGSYRFRLGRFECLALSDGSWDYPLKNFFANVPLDRIQEALRQRNLPLDYITTPYTNLYVDTGQHRVLVDLGAGALLGARAGNLLQSMSAAGIESAQIDTIVVTHAHPDHVGGAVDGEGRLLFPTASYYISDAEWQFWFSDASLAKAPQRLVRDARQCLEPLRDRLNLLDGETEIVPGVCAILAPGHTPGHMAVSLACEEGQLLHIGDAVLHSLHLEHPDWHPIYDILPEEAAASKRWLFDRAAEEKALVMGQHIPPFPSLGTVVKQGEGWRWRSIDLALASQA